MRERLAVVGIVAAIAVGVVLTLPTPVAAQKTVVVKVGETKDVANFKSQVILNGQPVSSAPAIARVIYRNGYLKVTGMKPGRATVTVSGKKIELKGGANTPLAEYPEFTEVFQVEVVPGDAKPQPVELTGNLTLRVNEKHEEDLTDRKITGAEVVSRTPAVATAYVIGGRTLKVFGKSRGRTVVTVRGRATNPDRPVRMQAQAATLTLEVEVLPQPDQPATAPDERTDAKSKPETTDRPGASSGGKDKVPSSKEDGLPLPPPGRSANRAVPPTGRTPSEAARTPRNPADNQDLSGPWAGADWGNVVVTRIGGIYKGTYTDTFGSVPGTFQFTQTGARSYTGTWGEPKRTGTFTLAVSEDGNSVQVDWRADGNVEVGPRNSGASTWRRNAIPPRGNSRVASPEPTTAKETLVRTGKAPGANERQRP